MEILELNIVVDREIEAVRSKGERKTRQIEMR
jgi:hypothetical protein